jgi:hypothetical protein
MRPQGRQFGGICQTVGATPTHGVSAKGFEVPRATWARATSGPSWPHGNLMQSVNSEALTPQTVIHCSTMYHRLLRRGWAGMATPIRNRELAGDVHARTRIFHTPRVKHAPAGPTIGRNLPNCRGSPDTRRVSARGYGVPKATGARATNGPSWPHGNMMHSVRSNALTAHSSGSPRQRS